MAKASVRSNLFTENLATISLHLRWQGGKQQTTLGTKYGFRSKLNFISYQRSKSREPNLSQRSKNKATTVTEWPLCRQDTSMKSIYSPFPISSILAKLEMAKKPFATRTDDVSFLIFDKNVNRKKNRYQIANCFHI